MRLDLTSLSFNSQLEEGVGTPSWGTALGQSEGYNITTEGANDLLLGMFNNRLNISNLEHNLRGEKDILLAACFNNVSINGIKISKPFILAIVEEHSQSHDGRKSLKYNDKFKYNDSKKTISNEAFYQKAQETLGANSCWFAYEFNFINGKELNIKAVIVSDKPAIYVNSKHRKDEWNSLIGLNPVVEVKTEVILRHKVIGQFVFNVLQHLVQLNKFHLLQKYLIRNSDDRFGSLIKDEAKLTSMFWIFNEYPTEEQLSQGGKIRAFNKFSFENDNLMYFLSKEWTDQVGHRLDINNFITIFNSSYNEFQITKINDEYCLVSILNGFYVKEFHTVCKNAGLLFSYQLIQRFIASLCTKPFVICSGLSGSGKTKLAQAFVYWICESENQYKIIPVGADWTNREPLLGYPNGLDPKSYVTPDSGALQLILEASKEDNQNKPYFMILDEMNLSHVERYFADFLSIMESKEKLKLYSGEKRYSQYTKENEYDEKDFIPYEIEWPNNLFIIGTVNIDETTYMFSPKVLDRANVIEFRITPKEMDKFFKERKELNMKELFFDKDKSKGGAGQNMAENFFHLAEEKTITKIPEIEGDDNILNKFFEELQIVGSEFGYRSATEIELLITKLGINGFVDGQGQLLTNNTKIDIAIMQKLLPKLHGSRKKLVGPLETLAGFCLERKKDAPVSDDQNKTKTLYQQFISEKRDSAKWEIKYSISFEKIERMLKNVIENGFTSYAEA